MAKIRKGTNNHYCKTPGGGSTGQVHVCSCGKRFRYQDSDRKDQYGRPLKGAGAWIQSGG